MRVGLNEGVLQLGTSKLTINSFVTVSAFKKLIVNSSNDGSSFMKTLPVQSPMYSAVFPVALSNVLKGTANPT